MLKHRSSLWTRFLRKSSTGISLQKSSLRTKFASLFAILNLKHLSHCLIIPKKKIERISLSKDSDQSTLGHLLLIARKTATDEKLDSGFRVIINNGHEGGESVPHLHVHLMGGRQMNWPPG